MKTTRQLTKQQQIARVKSQKGVTIRTAEGRSAPAESQAAASRLMKSFHAGARHGRTFVAPILPQDRDAEGW